MRRTRGLPAACAVPIALAMGLCSVAAGGGSSEQAVLIIDPTDPDSLAVGHHYAFRRGIPASHIVYMRPAGAAANYAGFGVVQDALLGELARRGVEPVIDYIVLAPSSQFFVPASGLVSDGCSPVNRFSTPACYTMAFIRNEVLSGTLTIQHINRYFALSTTPQHFDSQTAYSAGSPSTGIAARRYYLSGMLGYTGANGNTVGELTTMIDRSVLADGTRPAGTFYFMNNAADPARNVRQPQFAAVVTAINGSLGGTAAELPGVLPPLAPSVMGVMTGVAAFNWNSSGSTILPGAFCDHLTSYAATFDINDQTKVSEWIRAGASGSTGAVEEPCNYTVKFPHARLHAYYRQGLSLGEAYLRSVQAVPFQGLFYGDPLTRAYAWPPNVNVNNAPGGPVTGTVFLTPTGNATLPGAMLGMHELLIDGVSHGLAAPGGSFVVNTHQLDDGWHDVRVLSWDNSVARHTTSWTGSFVVVNDGMPATMSAPVTTTPALNDNVTVTLTGTGPGLREVRLLANGRVVAARATNGPVTVRGRNLGPGRVKVQCEALYDGGLAARSVPVELNITAEGVPPAPAAPVAFNYRKKMRRDRPGVVELPAAFADALSGANYQVLSGPANATLSLVGPTALVAPNPGVAMNDSFQFRVSTPGGTSNTATVTLWYACAADFDGDGATTVSDIFAFLAAWFAGLPAGDFDDSGGAPAVPDIFAFLAAWFAGCS